MNLSSHAIFSSKLFLPSRKHSFLYSSSDLAQIFSILSAGFTASLLTPAIHISSGVLSHTSNICIVGKCRKKEIFAQHENKGVSVPMETAGDKVDSQLRSCPNLPPLLPYPYSKLMLGQK